MMESLLHINSIQRPSDNWTLEPVRCSSGSARVLVTHQRQYLPLCDLILVLRDGKPHAYGTPAQLAHLNLDELHVVPGVRPKTNEILVRKTSNLYGGMD